MPQLSKERREALKRDIVDSPELTQAALAERHGVSRETVSKHARKLLSPSESKRRAGANMSRALSGDKSPRWKGPDHWRLNAGGYLEQGQSSLGIKQHRQVWESMTGITLPPFREVRAVVHHINGDKVDNRPLNLACLLLSDHVKLHKAAESGEDWTPEQLAQAEARALDALASHSDADSTML